MYNINKELLIEKDSPNKDILPKGTLNNQVFFVSHPNKNLMAYFYFKSAINGIIKLKNDDFDIDEFFYWSTSNEEIKSGNKTNIIHKKEELNGFISATADSKYIYALYSGKEMGNLKSMEELMQAYLSKTIYVFDWNGIPVQKYELDQEVRSIAINEKTGFLYAASYKGDEPHLVKFNISEK